jgi:hypothetical protein
LNTVVEIEHRKIAINIYDIFHNRILSTGSRTSGSRSKSAIVSTDWKFVEVPAADNSFETATDPIEDALVQELSWRMQFGLNGSSSTPNGMDKFAGPSDPDGPFEVFPWSNPTFRKNEIASYFGIDRLSQWKLSPAFARKYSLFDCTAGKLPSLRDSPCSTDLTSTSGFSIRNDYVRCCNGLLVSLYLLSNDFKSLQCWYWRLIDALLHSTIFRRKSKPAFGPSVISYVL